MSRVATLLTRVDDLSNNLNLANVPEPLILAQALSVIGSIVIVCFVEHKTINIRVEDDLAALIAGEMGDVQSILMKALV